MLLLLALSSSSGTKLCFIDWRLVSRANTKIAQRDEMMTTLAAKSHKVEEKFRGITERTQKIYDESAELIVGSIAGDVYEILDDMLLFTEGCVISDVATAHAEKICKTKKFRQAGKISVVSDEKSQNTVSELFDLSKLEQFYTAQGTAESIMVHRVRFDVVCHRWVTKLSSKYKMTKLPTTLRADVRNFVLRVNVKTVLDDGVGVTLEQKSVELQNVPKSMLKYVRATNPIFFRLLWKLCADKPQYSSWMAELLINRLDTRLDAIDDPFAVMEQTFKDFDLYFRVITDKHLRFGQMNNLLDVNGLVTELEKDASSAEQPKVTVSMNAGDLAVGEK